MIREAIGATRVKGTATTVAVTATAVTLFYSNRTFAGTASAGATTTLTCAALGGTDLWTGKFVTMTSGANVGRTNQVASYNTGTNVATFLYAFPTAVAANDTFVVVGDFPANTNRFAIWNVWCGGGNSSDLEQFDVSLKINAIERWRFTVRPPVGFPGIPIPDLLVVDSSEGDSQIVFDKTGGGNWSYTNKFFVQAGPF